MSLPNFLRKSASDSLPHFLCIGAQKAGTSWLYSNLRCHPQVWFPPIKELHYFDHLFLDRKPETTRKHIHRNLFKLIRAHVASVDPPNLGYLNYLTALGTMELCTEAWYRRVFSRPAGRGKLRGEVTPTYSTIPDAGVAYVRKFLGRPKIIYLIRQPVSRAMSHIRMILDRKYGENLERKISAWSPAQWLKIVNHSEIAQRGRYSKYVPTWDRHFGPGEILYLPYGRISGSPLELLQEVEDFLGLPRHGDYPKAGKQIHVTTKIPFPDVAIEELERNMAGETDFIAKRFGADFLAMT